MRIHIIGHRASPLAAAFFVALGLTVADIGVAADCDIAVTDSVFERVREAGRQSEDARARAGYGCAEFQLKNRSAILNARPLSAAEVEAGERVCSADDAYDAVRKESEPYLRACAEAGDPAAMHTYANFLRWHSYRAENQALVWYEKSYAAGPNSLDAFSIASLLASGKLGSNRTFEAMDWYYRAASDMLSSMAMTPVDAKIQSDGRKWVLGILERMSKIDRGRVKTRAPTLL